MMSLTCRLIRWGLAGFALAVFSGSAAAQSLASALPVDAGTRQAGTARRTVSLVFKDTPLRIALQQITQQASIPYLFANDVITHTGTVTATFQDTPVFSALEKVLQGTGVGYTINANGQLVFSKAKYQESQAETGIVTGKVSSRKTNAPIAGASVSVIINKELHVIATGSDGSFRIQVPAGEHTIAIRMMGYVRQVKTVMIHSGQTTTLDISLEPSASVLDEVVVTGTVVRTERKAIPNPITVITAEQIEQRGITRVDQLFRGEVPGVVTLERGALRYDAHTLGAMATSEVYSRGSSTLSGSPNPMKVYIDGIEMLDPSYLGVIDPVSIERIEIITGPQAATIYGSGAMGGVMQIFTKKGTGAQRPDVTLALQYGMLENNLSDGKTPSHRHTLNISGGAGAGFSYAGSASYTYSGQWRPHLFDRRSGASIGVTKASEMFTATGSISVSAGRNGTSNEPGIETFASQADRLGASWTRYASSGMVAQSFNQNTSVNVDYRMLPWWQHHLTVGRSETEFQVLPEEPRLQYPWDTLYRYRNSDGARITTSYNMSLLPMRGGQMTQAITLGLNGSSERTVQNHGCGSTKMSTTFVSCENTMDGYDISAVAVTHMSHSRWGAFGQWQVGFFQKVFLTLGLRGERSSSSYGERHKIDWTPTNGATFTQEWGDLTIKLLGSYGRATREPTASMREATLQNYPDRLPSQFMTRLANPDLTPEYSQGPQGGVEIYYGNVLSLSLNHYQQRVTDLIEYMTIDSVLYVRLSDGAELYQRQGQYVNTSIIKQYGWEATGTANVGPVSLKGTYSWNESRVEKRLTVSGIGAGFNGVPTHTANITVGYAAGGTRVLLNTNIIGATRSSSTDWTYWDRTYNRERAYRTRAATGLPLYSWARPRYMVSDLSLNHQLSRMLAITANISNLGNTYATEKVIYMPTLGRQTLIGLSFRFL